MLTRYHIEIDGRTVEVPRECLRNWDEIQCVYKRSDFSGVARTFTTQFEFVGEMYDRLMALYLRDGVNARAVLSLYTITDTWNWVEQFSCELDFSSIAWDDNSVKLNCIDNSLAALIKAKKSTKYEAIVDAEVMSDRVFAFNRLPIKDNITYAYTGGTSVDDSDGSIIIDYPENDRVQMGVVSDEEVSVNGTVSWNEDLTTDAGSHMLMAHGDVTVRLDGEIVADRCYPNMNAPAVGEEDMNEAFYYCTGCRICITRADGTMERIGFIDDFGPDNMRFCGKFSSQEALETEFPKDRYVFPDKIKSNYWALVNDEVWKVVYRGSPERTNWESLGMTEAEFRRKRKSVGSVFHLSEGDKVAIETIGVQNHLATHAKLYSSKFTFSWIAVGQPVSVSAFSPQRIGQLILNKMCLGHTNANIVLSDYDARLAKTVVVAAESLRGIPSAKVYTSFADFCDWMETVFGYTYYLADRYESKFVAHSNALGGYAVTPYTISPVPWHVNNSEAPGEDDIIYFGCYGKFLAHDGTAWYDEFSGVDQYNDPATGLARTDTIFTIRRNIDGQMKVTNCYFTINADGTQNYVPAVFDGNVEDFAKPFQAIVFVHRCELFSPQAKVVPLSDVRDLEYSVDGGQIYSTVNIGYDKKDYENINGRDEFNFNNTYSTGCIVSEKKLTMKSKYRADCYGIEFAVQKRGEDTTDTTSDSDVFFAYCKTTEEGFYTPDNTMVIGNAISDAVFNGPFSPMACVDANAGFIGMQSNPMNLEFASADGNSDIVIGGRPMKSSLTLSAPLMTCGKIQFSSPAVDTELDVNALYEVESNGVTYRGFLEEVSFKFAKAEKVKYKLIVKEVEL